MRYLGIDFGLRRVGLAVSEGNLASPWKVIEVSSLADALRKVEKVITAGGFEKVVIGLPEGKMAQVVSVFVKKLKNKDIDAQTFDETLSTRQAILRMIESNIPQKKRRLNDAYSAREILQSYLDERI